jgi:RNA polymerase sigma-70 factor (ECF subfamily)
VVEESPAAPGPRDELVILDEFVAGLGPADKALFVLYLEDLTYRQIAEVTGLTETHVGVKLHRLKRAFVERYL